MSKLVYTKEWETIGKALSPEVHQLITEWDTLSPMEQGERAGYAIGKHGADIFLPCAAAKAVSKCAAGTRTILTASKILNRTEQTLALEMVARSGTGADEIAGALKQLSGAERAAASSGKLSAIGSAELVQLEKQISEWLGEGAKFIRNEAGDPVFLSKDGLKCIRFDFNKTKPHNHPHAHTEIKVDGKWVKSGQIYPTDVPHN